MSVNQDISAGVIGVGSMGRHHARVYDNHPDAKLVGVSDADENRAAEIAERHGTRVLATEALLESTDVVSIAVPTPYHEQMVQRCLERGIDVLVEKPLVDDVDAGRQLVELAKSKGVTLQVGHIERFNPAFITLREIIEDFEIVAIDTERLGPPLDREVDDNVILDLMIHDIDLLRSLVNSEIASLHTEETRSTQYANALFRFECGKVASLTASRLTQQKVRRLRITAENAVIEVDYIDQSVEIHRQSTPEFIENNGNVRYRHESMVERPIVENGEPLENEIDAFLEAASNGIPPVVSGSDGLRAVELAQRINQIASQSED